MTNKTCNEIVLSLVYWYIRVYFILDHLFLLFFLGCGQSSCFTHSNNPNPPSVCAVILPRHPLFSPACLIESLCIQLTQRPTLSLWPLLLPKQWLPFHPSSVHFLFHLRCISFAPPTVFANISSWLVFPTHHLQEVSSSLLHLSPSSFSFSARTFWHFILQPLTYSALSISFYGFVGISL